MEEDPVKKETIDEERIIIKEELEDLDPMEFVEALVKT